MKSGVIIFIGLLIGILLSYFQWTPILKSDTPYVQALQDRGDKDARFIFFEEAELFVPLGIVGGVFVAMLVAAKEREKAKD